VRLFVAGLSYRSAPVAVRERYAVTPAQLGERDAKLVRSAGLDEGAIVSTCNRTEVLGVSRAGDAALERMHRFLHAELGDGSASASHVYELRDGEVVRHLFRVAGGLDSMVLGEPQILGQLKLAYRARSKRAAGPVLNRLFRHAFHRGGYTARPVWDSLVSVRASVCSSRARSSRASRASRCC
jgi:glutamyl-tRNA reductase